MGLRDVRKFLVYFFSRHYAVIVIIVFTKRYSQVYEDVKNVFIVAELMRGGELLDRIVKQKNLSEREAANIMYTLTSALAYLHNEGVSKNVNLEG